MECIFKCIIIEDDKNKKCLKGIVERFGFLAFCADSETSALKILKREHIDLIFIDITMAELDWTELAGKIRKSGNGYSDVPIVAVTPLLEEDEREKCFEAGMNECIAKPYGAYEVAEVIGRFCHLHSAL